MGGTASAPTGAPDTAFAAGGLPRGFFTGEGPCAATVSAVVGADAGGGGGAGRAGAGRAAPPPPPNLCQNGTAPLVVPFGFCTRSARAPFAASSRPPIAPNVVATERVVVVVAAAAPPLLLLLPVARRITTMGLPGDATAAADVKGAGALAASEDDAEEDDERDAAPAREGLTDLPRPPRAAPGLLASPPATGCGGAAALPGPRPGSCSASPSTTCCSPLLSMSRGITRSPAQARRGGREARPDRVVATPVPSVRVLRAIATYVGTAEDNDDAAAELLEPTRPARLDDDDDEDEDEEVFAEGTDRRPRPAKPPRPPTGAAGAEEALEPAAGMLFLAPPIADDDDDDNDARLETTAAVPAAPKDAAAGASCRGALVLRPPSERPVAAFWGEGLLSDRPRASNRDGAGDAACVGAGDAAAGARADEGSRPAPLAAGSIDGALRCTSCEADSAPSRGLTALTHGASATGST